MIDDFPAPEPPVLSRPPTERDCTLCGRLHLSVGECCPRCDEALARELDEWMHRDGG